MPRTIFTTCNRRHDGGRVYRDLLLDEHSNRINFAIIGSELEPPLSPEEVERRVSVVLYGAAAPMTPRSIWPGRRDSVL
jgi:hypothetical protein